MSSDECKSFHPFLLVAALFVFVLQMVIVITTNEAQESEKIKSSVLKNSSIDDFFETYYINEKINNEKVCFEDFYKDLKSEIKDFNIIQKVAKALSSISMCLYVCLAIYDFCLWCYNINFYKISFVVPIYGIISNVILMILVRKEEIIDYKCEALSSDMKKILNDELSNNGTSKLMSIISLPFNAVCFFVLLYYYCKERKSTVETTSATVVPITPIQPGMQPGIQPILQPGIQPISQFGIQPITQSGIQPVMQPIIPSIIQPGMQPVMPSVIIPEIKSKIKRHKKYNKKLKTADSSSGMM